MKNLLMTPIDFGKNFIYSLYQDRNAQTAAAALADDIVWVTPDEIFHLKTRKEIQDFTESLVGRHPDPCSVDIASIKSALVPGETNTVVYDVNLIPRREQDTVNLRCSLSICRQGADYRLIYVGMSRRYEPSEADQIREFIENVPMGLMVLAGNGTNASTLRELYANTCLAGTVGYDQNEFYDRSDINPFFMFEAGDQRLLREFCSGLMKEEGKDPGTLRITAVTKEGKKIPIEVTARCACREEKGNRVILYLMFSDMTALLEDISRQHQKIEADLKTIREEEIQNRLRSLDADAVREREEAKKQTEAAKKKIEETGRLLRQAQDAVSLAHKEAEEKLQAAADAAREKALQEADAERAALKEEKRTAEEALAKAQEEAKEAESTLEALRSEKEEKEQALEQRIHDLEEQTAAQKQELAAQKTAAAREQEALRQHLTAECDVKTDAVRQDCEDKLAALRKEKEEAEESCKKQIEDIRAEQEGNRQGYLTQIGRLQEEIRQKELGLVKQDTDSKVREKEKGKTVDRVRHLVSGQMNAIQSLAAEAKKNETAERLQKIDGRIQDLAGAVPGMLTDLEEIAKIDPAERSIVTAPFLLSECLSTVRKVIRPQCREKGIIFSCETNGTVPDRVVGSKPGLQLAFLGILENAVHNTASGGKIILTAVADAPVRDSCYFHFTIQDTGSGIPDEKLPVLFDDPSGELSIARKVISSMGGSIQVRSSYGSGSRFEISVSLQLGEPAAE